MALFVIYGNENSGKTHTCWLIYSLLKNAGKRIDYKSHPTQPDWTFSEVIQHIEDTFNHVVGTPQASDFRALFEYNGKKVAIISAGDYVHDPNNWDVTSFDDNMKWAESNMADHVICCTRSLNKSGSVQRYILDNYRMHIYRWYYKNQVYVLQEQIAEAQKVALEIIADIKRNLD